MSLLVMLKVVNTVLKTKAKAWNFKVKDQLRSQGQRIKVSLEVP